MGSTGPPPQSQTGSKRLRRQRVNQDIRDPIGYEKKLRNFPLTKIIRIPSGLWEKWGKIDNGKKYMKMEYLGKFLIGGNPRDYREN